MPSVAPFRAPTDQERGSADFLRLLGSASGRTGSALRTLAADAPGTTSIVALDEIRVVGLATSSTGRSGTVLHHLAVDHAHREAGLGRRLVMAVRVPGTPLVAETDDDAVGFYRRCGFTVAPLPRDPRWPDVQRYRCVLAAETS